MKVLIISDNPKRQRFHQIELLKNTLQNKIKNDVDLFAISRDFLFFNSTVIKNGSSMVLEELKSILKGKPYSLYVVSLEIENFKKILPFNKENFL